MELFPHSHRTFKCFAKTRHDSSLKMRLSEPLTSRVAVRKQLRLNQWFSKTRYKYWRAKNHRREGDFHHPFYEGQSESRLEMEVKQL
jgi:hypothetical protein